MSKSRGSHAHDAVALAVEGKGRHPAILPLMHTSLCPSMYAAPRLFLARCLQGEGKRLFSPNYCVVRIDEGTLVIMIGSVDHDIDDSFDHLRVIIERIWDVARTTPLAPSGFGVR